MKLLTHLPNLLKRTYQEWKEDRASRLSAALAYYTIFSLAPLLVLVIAITGLIWNQDAVRAQLLSQIQALVGMQGAGFIAGLINSVSSPGKDIIATIVGIVTLLLGALGVFNELHNSLNIIWGVEEKKPKNFLQSIKQVVIDRLLSFTMILGIGFLLLVSLVISAGLSASQGTIGSLIPLSEFIMQIVNLVISIGVITVLFALMFKFLPDAEIAWRDVWVGAFMTAIFFSLGKFLIGLYLGNSAVGSTFGAAGSLVLVLVWLYYSAQIFFFGAEFTQVYANQLGSKIVSEDEKRAAAQPQPVKQAETKRIRGRMQQPSVIPVTSTPDWQLSEVVEQENRQTARVILGMMVASFLSGIAAAIFGFRKK